MASPQIDPAVSYLAFLASVSDERLARVAARKAFVEAKQACMRTAAGVRGAMGPLLQRQARLAVDMDDLARVRAVLLEHLPPQAAPQRATLERLACAFDQDSAPR